MVACRDAPNVRVSEQILDTLDYVKSEPEARREGDMLYWNVRFMEKARPRLQVTYRAKDNGLMRLCASVAADPRECDLLMRHQGRHHIQKDGPARAEAEPGVTYTIVEMNEGDATAKNVVRHPIPFRRA